MLAEDLLRAVHDAIECSTLSSQTLVQRGSSPLPPPPPPKSRNKSRSPARRSSSRKRSTDRLRSEQWSDAGNLRSLLRSTGDRLEHEVRRAEEAISRAEYAQIQVDQNFTKYIAAQNSLQDAELRAREADAQSSSYKRQLEIMRDRLDEMNQRCLHLEDERDELARRVSNTKAELRELQLTVRSQEARDQGWEEGVKLGMMKRLNEERQKILDTGFAEGTKAARASALREGIRIGRKEGLAEGREQGMNEERRNAQEAFQVFLSEEMEGTDEWVSNLSMYCIKMINYRSTL